MSSVSVGRCLIVWLSKVLLLYCLTLPFFKMNYKSNCLFHSLWRNVPPSRAFTQNVLELCLIARKRLAVDLTFIGPCIVIYFYSKTNQMHHYIKFISFRNDTLHVSDGLSVHHQEFKTVHTSTRHTSNRYCCLLASYKTAVSVFCCMYCLELLMMDGKPDRNM